MRRLKKTGKYILLAIGIILIAMLVLWMLLQTKSFQNKILPIVTDIVSEQLGAEFNAKSVEVDFFKTLDLANVAILSESGDTLLSASKLEVEIGLFSFLGKKLYLNEVKLTDASINIEQIDGSYNFDFIIDHLSSNPNDINSEEPAQSWILDVEDIIFDNFSLYLNTENSELSIVIPELEASFSDFAPEVSVFHFDKLKMDGSNIRYNENKKGEPSNDKTTFPSLPFLLRIDDVDISNVSIEYQKTYEEKILNSLDPNNLFFEDVNISLDDLRWDNTLSVNIKEVNFKEKSGFEIRRFESILELSDKELKLEKTKLDTPVSSVNFSAEGSYVDFNSLINNDNGAVIEIDIKASKLSKLDVLRIVDAKKVSSINLGRINDAWFSGKVKFAGKRISGNTLNFNIDQKLKVSGGFSVENIDRPKNITYALDLTHLDANYNHIHELFTSAHFLDKIKNQGNVYGLVKLKGTYENVHIDQVNLTSETGIIINGKGTVSKLNESNHSWDLYFENLKINPSQLFRDSTLLPIEVLRLGQIEYAGKLKGNTTDVLIDGLLGTDIGSADLDLHTVFTSDYSDANYQGSFVLDSFDLEVLLQDTTYGMTNISGNISGHGISRKSAQISVNTRIYSFEYEGYNYEDIHLDGSFENNIFDGKVVSNDKNFNLNFEGKADLSGENSNVDFNLDIGSVNFEKLGFSDSLFVVTGIVDGNLTGDNIDNINGESTISNLKISTQYGVYEAGGMVDITILELKDNKKNYLFKSEFLDADVKGNINPSEFIKILGAYIKEYIPIEIGYEEDITNVDTLDKLRDYNFVFNANTKDIDGFLNVFSSKEIKVKESKITAAFSSNTSQLDIKGSVDSLNYGKYLIQRASYFFDGKQDFINGNINISDITKGKEILIPLMSINTQLNDKVADLLMEISNDQDETRLLIGGDLSRTDEYMFQFHDSLLLNNQMWSFSPYNQIFYGEDGLFLQDVKISKDNQSITIYTDENENGEALEILFDDFMLSDLSSIVGKENDFF